MSIFVASGWARGNGRHGEQQGARCQVFRPDYDAADAAQMRYEAENLYRRMYHEPPQASGSSITSPRE